MRARAALALALAGLLSPAAAADMTILVGFPPGQAGDADLGADGATSASRRLTSEPTYDDAGRFYAEHLGKFLPGSPSIVMKLVPGAASLLAARRLASEAPIDGSVLALLGPRVVLEPLVGPENAPWRPEDFAWIGARQRDDDLCVARADAPVKDARDLRTMEMFTAALAPGSRGYVYAKALDELAGARLKIISGYGGDFEVARAFETGEVDAWCGWSMSSLRNRHGDLVREGRARAIVQFTMTPAGQGLSIPRASDLPENANDREAMRAIETQTRFGAFALAAPPRTPPARVAELRAAFMAMARDADILAAAAARGIDIDPVAGEELREIAAGLGATSPGARERLRRVLRER